MRNRIIDYTFAPGTRTITLTKFAEVTVPDIRLIVNETQRVVICSSMQKELVTCSGNQITFVDTLPALQAGDQLTIEVDTGSDVIYAGGTDWVIEKKINSIAPTAEQEPWILTAAMAEQLRPLVEANKASTVFTDAIAGFFAFSLCTRADLSPWQNIAGVRAAMYAFLQSRRLLSVDLSQLLEIVQDYAAQSMFSSCSALQSVDLRALQTISGGYAAAYMFQNCSALQSVDLRSLQTISVGYAAQSMFSSCSALQSVDLRSLQTISGGNAAYQMFASCSALTTMHIGCGAIFENNANNPMQSATYLTDLYLYGTPTNNIYITWQPLNFASVLRVLQHIANDPDSATGKTLSFKSGLNFAVTQEEKDAYDAAKTTVQSTLGWTIQNAPNVHL